MSILNATDFPTRKEFDAIHATDPHRAAHLLTLMREAARRSLSCFVAYRYFATNKEIHWNWHLDYLCDLFTAVHGRDLKRTIINIPPRFLKSELIGQCFPAWMIGVDDSHRSSVLSASATASLAARDARKTLEIVKSNWYTTLFPQVTLAKENEAEWETTKGATRNAAGAGGTITGKGGDHLIADDLLLARDAGSILLRGKINEWLGETFRSRLNDQESGTITLIQQRLHENDPTGYLMAQGSTPGSDQYRHIVIPNEATVRTVVTFNDRTYAIREPGDLLHPRRMGHPETKSLKIALGHHYEAQYQQNPVNKEGGFFKESDLIWYNPSEAPAPETLNWMIGADYATSSKTTSDHTAIIAAGLDADGVLWIHPDSILERLDPLEAVTKTVAFAKRLKTYILGHEKGVIANTLAPLFASQMRAQKHYLAVEAYARTSGKSVHAASIKGMMQAQLVKLPMSRKTIWETQILRFRPDIDNDSDDLVDALATIGILMGRSVIQPGRIAAEQPDQPPGSIWEQQSNAFRSELTRRKRDTTEDPHDGVIDW